MDLLTLFAFTIAYVVAVLVPGPGVAAIVARALGGGFWSAMPMIIGILVGDLLYLIFALFGLAAIATLFGPLFIVIRFASAAYLFYIAWQFWTAKPGKEQLGPKSREPWLRTFASGFALTLGTPRPSPSTWRFCRLWFRSISRSPRLALSSSWSSSASCW